MVLIYIIYEKKGLHLSRKSAQTPILGHFCFDNRTNDVQGQLLKQFTYAILELNAYEEPRWIFPAWAWDVACSVVFLYVFINTSVCLFFCSNSEKLYHVRFANWGVYII